MGDTVNWDQVGDVNLETSCKPSPAIATESYQVTLPVIHAGFVEGFEG